MSVLDRYPVRMPAKMLRPGHVVLMDESRTTVTFNESYETGWNWIEFSGYPRVSAFCERPSKEWFTVVGFSEPST